MSKIYYFFNEYGECITEKDFTNEDDAVNYCEKIGAEYLCCD
jgi:hypothetical protein